MAELPPTDWDCDEPSTTMEMERTAASFSRLNIDAAEFVPLTATTTATERKETVNLIFCGHVDAGKSTIGGQILYLTGRVTARTLEKYQIEARKQNRESWFWSWALDTNEEERERGKTVEVGRAWFDTDKKHFIILDAPGHQYYVPNMIGAATQADVAILVISARQNEFETGFEGGGQTREHAILVKTAGVKHLIVLVNKMDDPTVQWDQQRFDDIQNRLKPFLKKCGFKLDEEVLFLPCSGFTGANLKQHPGESVLPWYKGPTLIEYLDTLRPLDRNSSGPFRFPIVGRFNEMGVINVIGKIESGQCSVGDQCVLMPNRIRTEIVKIFDDEVEIRSSISGDNVRLQLKNLDEEDLSPGSMLCRVGEEVCPVGKMFEAQIVLLDVKSVLTTGYRCMLHLHSLSVEIRLDELICLVDRKTGKRNLTKPRFLRQDDIAVVRFEVLPAGRTISAEKFSSFPSLGRFILRDEIRTVAMGKILEIIH